MSIQDQIAAAKLKAIDDWDAGHKNCDFGSKERAGGMRDGFGDGFEVGYLAALRSLFVEVKPEDCQDFEWYWILTDDGWRQAMRVGSGFDVISSDGQDLDFSCDQEEVKRIVEIPLPSPSDLFENEESQ